MMLFLWYNYFGDFVKKYVILFILVLSFCGCSESEKFSPKSVTCADEKEILKDDKAMLIDVRTEEEYKEGHLKNAINIPYEKIVEVLDTFGTIDFNVPIVVYCKSGGRSSVAATSLVEAGYKNIYDLGAMSNCN